MVSGCVSDEFAATALRLGADSYVTKPCSLGYLADRTKNAEQLRSSLRGLGNGSKVAA
jgi:DNA-binding response OmpR family regulator